MSAVQEWHQGKQDEDGMRDYHRADHLEGGFEILQGLEKPAEIPLWTRRVGFQRIGDVSKSDRQQTRQDHEC